MRLQTAGPLVRISANKSSPEIIMLQHIFRPAYLAIAAACAVLLPAAGAFASQGPGGGMGSASSLTQTAMAIVIYGASALIVGTGLIGALRQR
ncbi:hypothetical protein [uncultured Bradyrhizobium sp.]|uniref:hypothetical protein n=1 Tax=uncultured Bradyrhizobium sp. TaxID=199684 RepID=UPI0035CC6EEB